MKRIFLLALFMSPFVDVVIGLLTWLSGAEVEAIKSNYIIFIPAMVLRAFILLYSFFTV